MARPKGSKNKPKEIFIRLPKQICTDPNDSYGNEVGEMKIHSGQPTLADSVDNSLANNLVPDFENGCEFEKENYTRFNTEWKGRGIVLLALGNPQYGRMAANLAASIRYSDKDIPIALFYNGLSISHLTDAHKALFTSIEFCPPRYYYKGGREVYLKAKTCIYDISPFEETILIDVDMVWFGKKTPTQLFDSLKDIDFTIQNRGFADLSAPVLDEKFCQWCNIRDVRDVYETKGRFYHLASEFIYFKRTEENEQYFALVKEIFDEPLIPGFTFGGDLPDEFAFDIAAAVMGKYPHQDNYVPIYWFRADKTIETNKMMEQYYGYSIGGNGMPDTVLKRYTDLCKFFSKALRLPYHYNIQSKRQWLPERKNR